MQIFIHQLIKVYISTLQKFLLFYQFRTICIQVYFRLFQLQTRQTSYTMFLTSNFISLHGNIQTLLCCIQQTLLYQYRIISHTNLRYQLLYSHSCFQLTNSPKFPHTIMSSKHSQTIK